MSFLENVIDLECSLCLRRVYDPVILNCGHIFDRSCIQITNRFKIVYMSLCNGEIDPEKS